MFPECMRTSKTDEWATPSYVFDYFNQKYGFTLDVCANEKNHKCDRFFTVEDDGLTQDWTKDVCWMNPPYGKQIGEWIKKAKASGDNGATVVCLIPARTDTRYWHDYVMNADEIMFVKGRIHFNDEDRAPFPSAVVVFAGEREGKGIDRQFCGYPS